MSGHQAKPHTHPLTQSRAAMKVFEVSSRTTPPQQKILRGTIVTKAPLRVQFLPALGGRGWERGKAEASSSALLSKKGVGREGSIESQQKFDFFCSDIMPY